ncbi:MAG: hypothetical protein COA38_03070 [Fluviicola sp.]|nr:MAG: hypothetical protein COA38_03070 [Fluviicola sp.]
MTQREHQLSYCEICRNKNFSTKKGIICNLTKELASFDQNCSDFDEDPYLKKMNELSTEAKHLEATRESTFGLSAIGVTNGTIAGIIYIVLGIGSLLLTLFVMQMVTLWSFVLVIIGIVLIVKAAINQGNNKTASSKRVDLLDDEI